MMLCGDVPFDQGVCLCFGGISMSLRKEGHKFLYVEQLFIAFYSICVIIDVCALLSVN